ncbi:hypothetical protein H7849_07775 [Alloacidobacterium dinghuense]|uniref:Uncharacterized protein n=1 Tax=Alloacidobacterium dinghuense TaxID=2763107 RepID=A0A7G8BMN7_9BACT|nr:hypothetical protein [Alloacidobacterium dinghuense]QNI33807.1 hypothetical protein H7849_07775 [Alloacidobacterium dinghuense]
MIVVLSLLFVAFLFGIWMGLGFYRRITLKATANGRVATRYAKSGTRPY